MRFSRVEKEHLVRAWLLVSIAFGIVLAGGFSALANPVLIVISTVFAMITAGIGFIFHELAHKIVAQRFRYQAEFRANDQMLLTSLFFALFGFVFAAPGAVHIAGHHYISKKDNGIISLAGPLSSAFVSLAFLGLFLAFPSKPIGLVFEYGFRINAWLSLFNMIPILGFDGVKIIEWNKIAYFSAAAFAGILVLVSYLI